MLKKRGQVAIFVIIAILIVIGIILLFLYKDRLFPGKEGAEAFSPESYLKSCIEPYIKNSLAIQAKQGGFIAPEGYLDYKNEKITYICYTNEYFKPCVVQRPMIKAQMEKELEASVLGRARGCVESLIGEYKNRGFSANAGEVKNKVEILPGKIGVSFTMPLTVTKETSTQRFDRFDIGIKSEMYDLLLISENIASFEAEFGDSEITSYMQYYPDLKIEKDKTAEGSKIYTVTNVATKEKFRFATRSLVWSPGYGVDEK